MAASKCRTQHTVPRFKLRCDGYTPDRKAITHSFGHRIDVCKLRRIILSVKIPRPSVAALYLVCYKNSIVVGTQVPDFSQELSCSYLYASYTLDALNNN